MDSLSDSSIESVHMKFEIEIPSKLPSRDDRQTVRTVAKQGKSSISHSHPHPKTQLPPPPPWKHWN